MLTYGTEIAKRDSNECMMGSDTAPYNSYFIMQLDVERGSASHKKDARGEPSQC